MTAQTHEQIIGSIDFYGRIIGTPGMSEDVLKLSNKQLLRLLEKLNPVIDSLCADASGLIA